ncbi:MAG: hypothetical protein OEW05_09480 [Candidatus Aminicenantes bacterium]|nr:hypothetical protein [Candidatus Aminicenantes bacterium]
MKRIIGFIIAVLVLAGPAASQSDEVLKLKERIIDIQNRSELGFRDFTLCSKILSFSSYVPLDKNVVSKSGQLLVYYEPLNVFTSKKQGLYEVWYSQDMALLKASGETLQEWPDILEFHYTTKTPVMDLYAQNSLDLSGQLAPGAYKFKAVLKDKLSGKTATRVVDFEVR